MFNPHRPNLLVSAAIAALLIAPVASAAKTPTPGDPTAVVDSFKNGPYAKIGPFLGNLYDEYQAAMGARGKGTSAQSFKSADPAIHVANGMVSVDLYATDAAALARDLKALGASRIESRGPLFSARIPVGALGKLAALRALGYARPVLATTNALPALAVTQGDVSMNAETARTDFGVTGAGVPVGILSDSFACDPGPFYPGTPSSTYEQDTVNGELPESVKILKDYDCPGGTDEGRAMGQIVHDVAPGSPLLFHTAFDGELDFASGILALADNGAKVIVDDVSYFAEPMFSDGPIAQAIDAVTARGVAYFTSAGNQARDSYESAFRGVNVVMRADSNLSGGPAAIRRFHNFGANPDKPQILQPIVMVPSGGAGFVIMSFQWDQPFLSATTYACETSGDTSCTPKAATSDLYLVFFDANGHVVHGCPPGVARGVTCQIIQDNYAGGDAVNIAALYYAGPKPALFYVGIVLAAGQDPGHVKYSAYVEQGGFAFADATATHSGTAWGHSNSATGQAVGAASWYATVPWSTSGSVPPNDTYNSPPIDLSPCDPGCLNDFSSAGNVPIYLDKFGNPLAKPERRQQPSVTGPDGGNSSFFYSDSSYDDDDGNGYNSPLSTFITPLDQPGNEFPNFFGTSAAAPHVAAVAALMLQEKPGLTPAQIRAVLEETARPIDKRFTSARPIETSPIVLGSDGYNDDAGHGLVDAEAALQQVSEP